jgi:hypothetical protein
MLNAEVRDPLDALQDVWDTYAPTWTASVTAPKLGNGTLSGRFLRVGQTVDVRIFLKFGSTTDSGSGNLRFSLPVAAKTGIGSILHVAIHIASFTQLNDVMGITAPLGSVSGSSSTGPLLVARNSSTNGGDLEQLGANYDAGADPWSTDDYIAVFGRYEAA